MAHKRGNPGDRSMHIAQVALALVVGGASILIIAALVVEAVHGQEGPRRRQGEPDDALAATPAGASAPFVLPCQTVAVVDEPGPHPRTNRKKSRGGKKANDSGPNDRN